MEIPDHLINQIKEGRAVLFLGAGASACALDDNGKNPPTTSQLAAMLSQKFLGGKYDDHPLGEVGDLSISESNLFDVQGYICDIFHPFKPSKAHSLMSTFRWKGIATTNYDQLIEKAYLGNRNAFQKPVAFIENGDLVEDKMRDNRSLPLLKLHGCSSKINNKDCPLILSNDHYIQYRRGRDRIFLHFREWASNHPIIFIGSGMQDSDIREIIGELSELGEGRQRSYAITPTSDDIQRRFWDLKKITIIDGTFDTFLDELDSHLPSGFRGIVPTQSFSHPILDRFRIPGTSISDSCRQFLQVDVDYVRNISSTTIVKPPQFYKGYNPGWSAVEQNLDVRRRLVDIILDNHFFGKRSINELQFVLLKGHAGAGKTIILRRIAWDAAHELDCNCLFLRDDGKLDSSSIKELVGNLNERLYVFIDNVADRVAEINHFANAIGSEGEKITIVCSERVNEWNIACNDILDLVTDEYDVRYLNMDEIKSLVNLLDKNRSLGTLQAFSDEERISALEKRAGRQLLVALHEATLGRPFEDIIEDEFRNIKPDEAQSIYLTICALNRLDVVVRAGVISRIHNIGFTQFKDRFFGPLENVVFAEYNALTGDYEYKARHSHIAAIVFERMLGDMEGRYVVFVRTLNGLNLDYKADRTAFREMIKARNLQEMFTNHDQIKAIYEMAQRMSPRDHMLLHQIAIYEMHRANGSLSRTQELLEEAKDINAADITIDHSMAELFLRRASQAESGLQKESYLKDAIRAALKIINKSPDEPYGYHTLIKAQIERIGQQISKPEFDNAVVEDIMIIIEKTLRNALQRFPGNSYLFEADAQLAALIEDSDRAQQSLIKAFDANPRASFIALRLAALLVNNKKIQEAKKILEAALDSNPNEASVHFAYAKLLIDYDLGAGDPVLYYLKRSFNPGDRNYLAQILYGRQLFIMGKTNESIEFFKGVHSFRCPPAIRDELRYTMDKIFSGEIKTKEVGYCFISMDQTGDSIFAHKSNSTESIWPSLVQGLHVKFKIAFTLRGPQALDLNI